MTTLESITRKSWFERMLDGEASFDELPIVRDGHQAMLTFLGTSRSLDPEKPTIHYLLTPLAKRLDDWGDYCGVAYVAIKPTGILLEEISQGKLHKKGNPRYIRLDKKVGSRVKKRLLPFEAVDDFSQQAVLNDHLNLFVQAFKDKAEKIVYDREHAETIRDYYHPPKSISTQEWVEQSHDPVIIDHIALGDAAASSRARLYGEVYGFFSEHFGSTRPLRRRSLQGLDLLRRKLIVDSSSVSSIEGYISRLLDSYGFDCFDPVRARFKELPLWTPHLHKESTLEETENVIKSRRDVIIGSARSTFLRTAVTTVLFSIPGFISGEINEDFSPDKIYQWMGFAAGLVDASVQIANGIWSHRKWGVAYTPGITGTIRELMSPDNMYES